MKPQYNFKALKNPIMYLLPLPGHSSFITPMKTHIRGMSLLYHH